MRHDQDAAKAAAFHTDRTQALKTIRAAYQALTILNDISRTKYLTELAEQIRQEEKTVERSDDTLSRTQRVELYTVWRIAQYMTGERMPVLRDYLCTRTHIYIAASIVLNYREKITEAWKSFDVETLALIDFAKLNK
jgi:hypothetical protein